MSTVIGYPIKTTNFNVVHIGDSLTNGSASGNVASAMNSQILGNSSPLDFQWNGTTDAAYFSAFNAIGTITGAADPNIGANTNMASFTAMLPAMLRASCPSLRNYRSANLGIGGSSSYTWTGAQANGWFQCSGVAPNDGDTATLGSVTYTFRTSATLANEVTIGTNAVSMQRLGNAINAEGAGFGAGTVINPDFFCPNVTSSVNLHFFAVLTGTAGNAFSISSSSGGRVVSTDSGLTPAAHPSSGTATNNTWTNNIALVSAGFGTVNAITLDLGTNDAARTGYRGRGTQTELTTLVARLAAQWPQAPIVMWRPPATGAGGATATALTNVVLPAVDAVIAANPGLCFSVNINSLGAGTGDVAVLGTDGVHLTPYGYMIAAQMTARAIASATNLL